MAATVSIDNLRARVYAQKDRIPAIYGNVDFSAVPERFADAPDDATSLSGGYVDERLRLLADPERLEFIRAYTMMGDGVADAYAALMRDYGFRRLVDMLVEACDHGVEKVADAPPELVAFIADMERIPDWLDMALVEEGARLDRNSAANLGPFIIRGAFIATFMNKYAALPMAITNTLSRDTAARRVKETATFFTTSVLPGALERFGPGFKSAAMVRLMHSMVRANVMRRPKDWDVGVFGIPIPQVDQMPAGLIAIFLMSYKILAKGRNHFTRSERARVELARYRCFLLGLPEDLLADTPQGIVDLMTARGGTLRSGYDDHTCGELLRATMAADLRPDASLSSRIYERFERSFSKLFFVQNFMAGDRKKAAAIGVALTRADMVRAAAAGLYVYGRIKLYALASHIPGLNRTADRRLVAKLKAQLASYGHAEFTTDAAQYRAAPPPRLATG
ncbi:oxygenase MpaB family protein [Sphingopyxis sp. PET50]|uniref:oxygenase MpaB family protein n=1 Tax=Sphingopyxis sp. PET50 TaxID=2976533 RepID=UPI0021AE7572|nr:oxygenase MpaB family protein [Sphingopyxis sp. PET50]